MNPFVGLFMEGSGMPVAPKGDAAGKRRSRKTNIEITPIAIVVVVMVVAAATLIYSPPANPSILPYGLQGGDHFLYDATGTYNNSTIGGIYNLTLVGNVSISIVGGYSYLNSTIPDLNHLINAQSGFNLLSAQGHDIGVGKINTSYGVKNVNQFFEPHKGWTVVYYQGADPLAIYGCVANGPNFHLSLTLNRTNNHYAIANNTPPHEPPARQIATSGSSRYGFDGGDHTGQLLYLPNGADFSFNITGNGTDMYTYNEANIFSMANGGQFTYYAPMTRLNVTNSTSNLLLPPGYYITAIFAGNGPGEYDYNLKVL